MRSFNFFLYAKETLYQYALGLDRFCTYFTTTSPYLSQDPANRPQDGGGHEEGVQGRRPRVDRPSEEEAEKDSIGDVVGKAEAEAEAGDAVTAGQVGTSWAGL